MPGFQLPKFLPNWLRDDQASVMEPWWQTVARKGANLLGANDPAGQVMGIGGPMTAANTELKGPLGKLITKGTEKVKGVIKAYHGSGADFDKFDPRFIGSGEGAQAYAYGHYLAEAEDVAKTYRMDAHRTKADPVENMVVNMFQNRKGAGLSDDAAREQTRLWAASNPQIGPKLAEQYTKGLPMSRGHMYEVEVGVGPEHLLDWDAPLSRQSPQIQQAVEGIVLPKVRDKMPLAGGGVLRIVDDPDLGPKYFMEMGDKRFSLSAGDVVNLVGTGSEGKSVYQGLTSTLVGGDQAASHKLLEKGIPGVKYLDQNSRVIAGPYEVTNLAPAGAAHGAWIARFPGGTTARSPVSPYFATREAAEQWGQREAGKASRNIVMFPGTEDLITILRKYGILPPLAAGAVMGGANRAEAQTAEPTTPRYQLEQLLQERGAVGQDPSTQPQDPVPPPSPQAAALGTRLAGRGVALDSGRGNWQPPAGRGAPPPVAVPEAGFQQYYQGWAGPNRMNRNADDPAHHYDYRAAYRQGVRPPEPGKHWPSPSKDQGHPDIVVGGFHTQTGERVPGTPRASESELVGLGWTPEAAARLAKAPEPPPPSPVVEALGQRLQRDRQQMY